MKKKTAGFVLAACMSVSMIMTGSSAAAAESGAQAPSENEYTKTDDGIPWIDSELKENITDDMPVDPKYDFHLYANKEWLLSNEIPDGYSTWSHYYEREVDVQNQCLEILKDESAEGHDAELIYTYYKLLLDWEERNKSGVSELQGIYDRILSAENLDDITNLMMDPDPSFRVSSCLIPFTAEVGLNDPDTYLKEEFKKRVKKIDDYLDTIIAFGGQHFIGTSIDTEMIADMTGLQCALRMASKVPDFDYQKFFTKYARMNGSLGLYSAELKQLSQDEHPLNYARTNVPVQQFDEFYQTYDVKEGDAMYLAPEDRLLIW